MLLPKHMYLNGALYKERLGLGLAFTPTEYDENMVAVKVRGKS